MHAGEPDAREPADTTPATAPAPDIVLRHRPCTRCSYNLYGLPIDGSCPECGNAVSLSLRGDLLQHASPEYIATLRSGFSIVLNTLIFIALFPFTGFFSFNAGIHLFEGLAALACYGVLLHGYLKITQGDPGFVGVEPPGNARDLLRLIILFQAGVKVLNIILGLFAPSIVLQDSIVTTGYVLWAVHLYVMMRYLRWLGGRVPDQRILRHSKIYMWLLPLLSIIGAIYAIGPLIIAIIIYWFILNRLETHLISIQRTGLPADLNGVKNP